MKITLEDCILEHIKRYPEMEIQDVVKIVFSERIRRRTYDQRSVGQA